ncbi:MAG: tRNA pseudouridine(55) synthase, partial [Bacteroidota bacterium]|nr:tRNA pseudouridine(55) synthase [Bacteroidota bacterium]
MDLSLKSIQEGTVLVVDKPLEWSSFDVVNKIRNTIRNTHRIKKIKVGHAGTLDPMATGVLVVCTGKKTKEIHFIQDGRKEYLATLKLGATTPSYDTETEEDQTFPIEHITREKIEKTLHGFKGEIDQYPPIFSAIRKDGKRLYEFARKGEEVEIEPRKVTI